MDPHRLRPVRQEVQDPVAEGGAQSECGEFMDQCLWDYGVEGGCEVHEEQTDVRVLALQMGEGCVNHRGDGVLCGSVRPVGVLMWVHSDIDGIFDAGHNQSLKALHDYRSEGHRPIVIQACHCGGFGDGDDSGGLQAGGDGRLCEGGVVDVRQHQHQQ